MWFGTFHSLLRGLRLQNIADVACATGVQGTLERIAFPTEDVVAVPGVAIAVSCFRVVIRQAGKGVKDLLVASAEDEWLGAIFGP